MTLPKTATTVGELIEALKVYTPDTDVRSIFDAGGELFFPPVRVQVGRNVKGRLSVVVGCARVEEISDVRNYVELL